MRYLLSLLLMLPVIAWGQSSLPPCPVSGFRNNCIAGEKVNGNTYFGEYRNGKPNGIGSLVYVAGDQYVGEWVDGQRNGDGIEYRANGSVFEAGHWISGRLSASTNIQRNRFPFDLHIETARLLNRQYLMSGLYISPNSGRVYQGEFKDGRFVGKSQDGVSVSGEVEGVEIVFGEYAFADGSTFKGGIKDGRFHGHGVHTLANGVKYLGEFRDGYPHGLGTVSFADGRKHVFAEWKKGSPSGEGIRYYPDGTVQDSGRFEANRLVFSYPIDTHRFPFNPTLVPARPTVDTRKAEPDQFAVEIEAERKKRQELEERLAAAESREREQRSPSPPVQVASPKNPHALIIGNAAYPGSSRLDNPINDAKAIEQKLNSMGFTVTVVTDASRQRLVQAMSQFRKTASNADLSLLFYSGHGVQIFGTNYILPIDVDQSDVAQATIQGVSLNSVVENFLPGKTKIVFLDACRDNPLQRSNDRSVSKGLAPISVAQGTLIAYATKDGQTASDGVGQKNSPFTKALLEHLSDPQDIAVILRKVREKVMTATRGKQQPWEYGSLTGGELVLSGARR
jgi:hypothetical protein